MSLRILYVTPYVPSMVRVRPFAFIRELARQGHQVTLACLVLPKWEERYLEQVRPYCQAVYPVYLQRFKPYLRALASLPTRVPLSVAYCHSTELQRVISERVQRGEFDLVHTEFVRAAPATLYLEGLSKVFDAVDSLTLTHRRSLSAAHVSTLQRLLSLLEWAKMRSYEPWVLRHYDRAIASSPTDRRVLKESGRAVEVIPNGVDLEYFAFHPGQREPADLVFLGKMSYYVNVASVLWFYRRVFPLVRRQHPRARLVIVGRDPVSAITALRRDPAVEVTGTVPDVRPYLKRAAVSICPMMSGAGIQNKMLEAMAVGVPAVATSLACQALQARPGQEVLVADTVEDFAAAVTELLDSPARRQHIAQEGRHYVETFHNWTEIGNRLYQLYQDTLQPQTVHLEQVKGGNYE